MMSMPIPSLRSFRAIHGCIIGVNRIKRTLQSWRRIFFYNPAYNRIHYIPVESINLKSSPIPTNIVWPPNVASFSTKATAFTSRTLLTPSTIKQTQTNIHILFTRAYSHSREHNSHWAFWLPTMRSEKAINAMRSKPRYFTAPAIPESNYMANVYLIMYLYGGVIN